MGHRFNTSKLYFAECRYCIMDIINSFVMNGKIISPRPDYVDYYTILMEKKDGTLINIFNTEKPLVYIGDCQNLEENYDSDIIISSEPLSNYTKQYDKLNYRECALILETIKQTKGLKANIGYKRQRKLVKRR